MRRSAAVRLAIVALAIIACLTTLTTWLDFASERSDRVQQAAAASFARRTDQIELLTRLNGVMILLALALCAALLVVRRLWRARHTTLIEARARHTAILDSAIDGILILDPSGMVETANKAALAMLGYGNGELERRDASTILDIAPGEGSFHKRLGLIDGVLHAPLLPNRVVRHHGGCEIPVDIALGVMDVPGGKHVVVSLRDISERKRIERVKDDLMSTVSHELRTPLASIVGSLGLLRAGTAGSMTDQAGRLVEIAENNSRRLIRLVNDMLDIDRIEAGKLVLKRMPSDLRNVARLACVGSEGLARVAGIQLTCREDDRAIVVSADADRLVQVLANLLSNAIRASPEGSSIDIHATVHQRRALLLVEDRGPGIPAEFRSRIFGRFERANRDEGAAGTGLGLAISREIVMRHDGEIRFEDREGGGTRFVVSLPLLAAGATTPMALICEADEALARGPAAIVVVEGGTVEQDPA